MLYSITIINNLGKLHDKVNMYIGIHKIQNFSAVRIVLKSKSRK